MYTSGWPKNQKRCWYRTGSPPPTGWKNEVLKFRSVKSMVIAPARTGRERSKSTVVTIKDQTKRGTRSPVIPCFRVVRAVTRKLIDPRIDLAPARWREKMAMSTAGPLWNLLPARGG